MSARHERRDHRGIDAGAVATVVALVVAPVAVTSAGVAAAAWVAFSYRGARQYRPSYSVPSLRELRSRAVGPIVGRPGAHAQRLARTHTARALAVVVGGTTTAAAAALLGLRFGTADVVGVALAVVVGSAMGAVASIAKPAPMPAAAGRARAGVRHELLALAHIVDAQADIAGVVCGWMPPGRVGDIDAAVVLRNGAVVAVETKTGHGPLRLAGDTVVAGDHMLTGDPIGQVRRAATSAHAALGAPILPVVCVPRSAGRTQHASGTHLVGGAELTGLLAWAATHDLPAPAPETTLRALRRRGRPSAVTTTTPTIKERTS